MRNASRTLAQYRERRSCTCHHFTVLSWFCCILSHAPLTARSIGFEDVTVPKPPGYINGSAGPGGTTSSPAAGRRSTTTTIRRSAIGPAGRSANVTDVTTQGFGNQYSAYNLPSGGGDNSPNYAVGYVDSFDAVTPTITLPAGTKPQSARITNTTYAALIMLDGDPNDFARQFDVAHQDFFTLTISGLRRPRRADRHRSFQSRRLPRAERGRPAVCDFAVDDGGPDAARQRRRACSSRWRRRTAGRSASTRRPISRWTTWCSRRSRSRGRWCWSPSAASGWRSAVAAEARPPIMGGMSVLDQIGHTPLVRLDRIAAGLPVPVYGKCEHLNPGGSVKDRIALAIVDDAEAHGLLKPGATLVEATAGNTGVGLALVAAVRGYRLVCVLPAKMSVDKRCRPGRARGRSDRDAERPAGQPGQLPDRRPPVGRERRWFLTDQLRTRPTRRSTKRRPAPRYWSRPAARSGRSSVASAPAERSPASADS